MVAHGAAEPKQYDGMLYILLLVEAHMELTVEHQARSCASALSTRDGTPRSLTR